MTALNNILLMVKSAIDETRRISKNLHPSVLDDLGLKAAIRDLIGEFRGIYPTIAIRCSVDIDETEMPDALKILIYRVCQEALTNIGKHSHAGHADLELLMASEKVVLEIKDDGIGIQQASSAAEPNDGFRFGLLNIHERIDLTGGRLEIRSESGQGMYLRADWPLR